MKKIFIIALFLLFACAAAASAASPWSPKAGEYWIKVNKQQLRLTLFKGGEVVKSWPVSIGKGRGSGGQQQRVSIGRALVNNPALMLADEPTGNLDSENSKEIISLLRQFNKDFNQTVIIITHDEKIANSADRVITIEDGKITGDEVRIG